MNGRISIEGLKIDCVIGVYAHERIEPQTIIVDVDLIVDISAACRDDTITSTVDYEAIANTVKTVATNGRYQLVEKLADVCAVAILKSYPVSEVFVRVRKPHVVAGTDTVGVSVVRRRQGLGGRALPEPSVEAASLENQVVAITGADDECGCAVAGYLAAAGAHVILLAERGDRLRATAESIRRATQSDQTSCIECDVRSSASVKKAFGEIETQHARLDALVNLARDPAGAERLPEDRPASELIVDAERVVSANLLGTMRAVFAAESIMRHQSSGVIITFGTAAAIDCVPDQLVDQIASAGVRQLTQALAARHGPHSNTRLYWLALGQVFTAAAYESSTPAQRARASLDGWMDPREEIAPVIAALISGKLARTSGSTIRLDPTTIRDLFAEIGKSREEIDNS